MAGVDGQEPTPDGQVLTGADGQSASEPNVNDSGAASEGMGSKSGGESFDAEYVKKLRSEAAENRRKLRDLETRVKAEDDKKLSETERMQKRLAELEKEAEQLKQDRQERTVRYETMLAAGKLNIVDPDAAFRLMDASALEFDENGSPTNVEKVLQGLIKARPYLVKPVSSPDINAGEGRGAGSGAGPGLSEAQIQEYAARFGVKAEFFKPENMRLPKKGQ